MRAYQNHSVVSLKFLEFLSILPLSHRMAADGRARAQGRSIGNLSGIGGEGRAGECRVGRASGSRVGHAAHEKPRNLRWPRPRGIVRQKTRSGQPMTRGGSTRLVAGRSSGSRVILPPRLPIPTTRRDSGLTCGGRRRLQRRVRGRLSRPSLLALAGTCNEKNFSGVHHSLSRNFRLLDLPAGRQAVRLLGRTRTSLGVTTLRSRLGRCAA